MPSGSGRVSCGLGVFEDPRVDARDAGEDEDAGATAAATEHGEPTERAHSARALVQPGVAPSQQAGGHWAEGGSAVVSQAALLLGWVLPRATRTET